MLKNYKISLAVIIIFAPVFVYAIELNPVRDFALNFGWETPSAVWEWIDGWFFNVTGLYISEALKAILNIAIGVLGFILDILKWILSLFG